MKKIRLNKESVLKIIVFILYGCISLYISYKHEIWSDEAQNWLLVKDLNIFELFNQLKYEGHPIVWYLLLMPFVKLNCSVKYMFLLPYFISLISSYIIIFKFKIENIIKIIILFSVPFIYVCPAFLRSYALCILLICLVSLIYSKRYSNPIIYSTLLLLLENTHILCFGFISSLIIYEIYLLFINLKINNKKHFKEQLLIIGVFVISSIFLILQLVNTFGAREDIFAKFNILKFFISILNIMCLITRYNLFFEFIFIFLIIIFSYILLKNKDGKILLFLIYNYIFFAIIDSIWILSYWNLSLLLATILFVVCNYKLDKFLLYTIIFILLINFFSYYFLILNDIKYEFSSAKRTSLFIKENIDINTKIYCYNETLCSTLALYLNDDYDFYDVYDNKSITWVNWPRYEKHRKEGILYSIDYNNKEYFITDKMYYNKYPKCNIIFQTNKSVAQDYIICEKNKSIY